MAQVEYDFPITRFKGKVCKHAKVQFKKYGPSGKFYTSQVCNPSTATPTADQLTAQALFKAASDYAKSWMADPTHKRTADARWKAAKKAGQTDAVTLRSFLMKESFNGDEVPVA